MQCFEYPEPFVAVLQETVPLEIDHRWIQMAALSNEDRKEKLSLAWLAAMASVAGFAWDTPVPDRDSIDATLSARGPRNPKLDVQIKATASATLRQDGLHFRLSRKNYDDLRVTDRMVPLILVVVELPETESQWIQTTDKKLVLRRRAWWTSLRGERPITTQSKYIVVPNNQLLDVNRLTSLMVESREGKL